MEKKLIDLYHSELEFLMQLRLSINSINNRIHDKVSLIAIEMLKTEHPKFEFLYTNAGAAGFDIKGMFENKLKLIAEVKTSDSPNGSLKGPQLQHIKDDLERLKNCSDDVIRYMILLTNSTKSEVMRRLNVERDYKEIIVMNILEK